MTVPFPPFVRVYRGRFAFNRYAQLAPLVTVNDQELPVPPGPARTGVIGFAWGYGGAGPQKLAYAIILHATGDRRTALRAHRWFMWATVANWGSTWSITADQVRVWLDQFERESRPAPKFVCGPVRRCRVCRCTEDDCSQCVEASGLPCSWVPDEPDLCTRCADEARAVVALVRGGAA